MLSYPHTACVVDEQAGELLRSDGFGGTIIVTGNPAYDPFFAVDAPKERAHLRQKFGLSENQKVLLYVGQGTPLNLDVDKKSFAFLAATLKSLDDRNTLLAIRPHPRAETTEHYKKNSKGLPLLDTKDVEVTDELLFLADVVVSMYASNLIHAAILKIPAVSLMLPDAAKMHLAKIHLDDFPLNKTGATIGVYSDSIPDFVMLLKKLFYDGADRNARNQKNNPLSLIQGSAERVVEGLIH